MRLRLLVLAGVLASASGCASSRSGEPADYVLFRGYDRTWEAHHLGIRHNSALPDVGPPVTFNLVMSYSDAILVGSAGHVPPEVLVWVGYGADDSLGLGEGSQLALYIDGSAVVLPSASDVRRRSLLLGPFDRQRVARSEFLRGDEPQLPAFPLEAEFGGGGEFGLYPLPREVVRQLASAVEVRFEVRGVKRNVERELGRPGLGNVQRFLRERLVRLAWPFLT